MRLWVKLIIGISLLSLVSCALISPKQDEGKTPETEAIQLPEGKGWWYVRFHINWPDEIPHWYIGTLLAGEVIAPILSNNRENIELWRFHRRAVRDGYDHVFSFVFYSSAKTAENIYGEVIKDPLLSRLRKEKMVIRVGLDDLTKITRPDIKDTSDPEWPEIIQSSWPTFIMGASQMWLDLVIDLANKEDSGQEEEILYAEVQNQINKLWMVNGKHVWLHHLNALYAYQPLFMRY